MRGRELSRFLGVSTDPATLNRAASSAAPDYAPPSSGAGTNAAMPPGELPPPFLLGRVAPVVLRWALGLTLLSAVADRFGWWGAHGSGANVNWGDWAHFVAYTAKVNGFLPAAAALAPTLAVAATAAEILLGVALLLGVFPRAVAWGSVALFAAFAGAMTLSLGVQAPLNYSVFADAAGALLLAAWPSRGAMADGDGHARAKLATG